MTELRESLDEALRAVNPGDPPVREAIRRGKAIRTRRRAGAVAAVAALAVAVGTAYPALTHREAAPQPATPAHRHASVTDVPPGRGAPAGTIATGTINGQSWQVYTDNPKTNGAPGQQCAGASGPALGGAGGSPVCFSPTPPGSTDPVAFEGGSVDGYAQASVGQVAADVSYVLVRLSDDSTLKLIPVKVYGTRWVAFASPPSLAVASATAYLSDGRHLTAIPFDAPGGIPVFGTWLSPGQPVPARVSKRIASGSAGGAAWAVQVDVGPWGACFSGTGSQARQMGCVGDGAPLGTQMFVLPGDSPGVVAGWAAAGVRYLTITMTDGSALRVTPVLAGGQRYFAFYLDRGQQQVRGWAAYDAAGKRLSSGTLS